MTPQHRIPLTVVQMSAVELAHQLNIYSKGCFCLLPAEDLDGQENKCVFYLFVEHSGIVVSAWGERFKFGKKTAHEMDLDWLPSLLLMNTKKEKQKNRRPLPQNHDLDSMSSGLIISIWNMNTKSYDFNSYGLVIWQGMWCMMNRMLAFYDSDFHVGKWRWWRHDYCSKWRSNIGKDKTTGYLSSLGLFPAMSVVKEPGKPQHDLDPNSN